MNQKEFEEVVAETLAATRKLLTVKGGEYAGNEDRLANFKRGAQLTGATALQVAFIYASKHYDGIATYVRRDKEGSEQAMSEPIEGRLDDLINYCILMKAIIKEQQRTLLANNSPLFRASIPNAVRTDKSTESNSHEHLNFERSRNVSPFGERKLERFDRVSGPEREGPHCDPKATPN